MIDRNELKKYTRVGELFTVEGTAVRCQACAHRCLIAPEKSGICGVRYNENGQLRVLWGYAAGVQLDPVEKKPFNHFLPGRAVVTFGMLGCNFHCEFCQNWVTSQALRDETAGRYLDQIDLIDPVQLAEAAVAHGAAGIVSSYNEPLISSEWAVAIFSEAKKRGLKTAYVSNGFATPEVLEYLHPYLDAYKVDLKSMQEARYREMGGRLQPVLDTIALAKKMGLWVEVVSLLIPGFNDSVDELWQMGSFISHVSAEIPWHVTAFHPDYHMDDRSATVPETLQRAAEIGEEAGLHFVYAGNLPGRVGSLEDTRCPHCGATLIQRRGYHIRENRLTAAGSCPDCGAVIPGIWQ
jgi:pyruvate formate lyase activating enzyme